MLADDKTHSVTMILFSHGKVCADDMTTKPDRTLSVVKTKGFPGGRRSDDKTSPPLRGRFCRRRRTPCRSALNSGREGEAGAYPYPSRLFQLRQVATTNPAPTGGKGFVVVAGLAAEGSR